MSSQRPYISGFCNPTNPPDSHQRCAGTYSGLDCTCWCHWEPTPTTTTSQEEPMAEPANLVEHPGFVHGMPDDVYHSDPVPVGSLSSTFARLLTEHVPAKARAKRLRKPTRAMNLGKAAHLEALGAGPELVVWQYDGRTRDGKAERAKWKAALEAETAVAVSSDERDRILGMADALRADETINAILESSQSEVSAFCQVGPVWLRARIDLLGERDAWDYKTTEDASRRGFQKALGNFSYHQQADLYQRVLAELGHPAGKRPFKFICQETEAPYLVQIHQPDRDAMEAARELNDRAIRIFAECLASGVWPGYEKLVAEPTPLPAFYWFNHEDVLDLPSADMVI